MTPMCMIYLPQVEFLGRGRRPSEGWKEVSNAVGGRPWPPCFQALTAHPRLGFVPFCSNSKFRLAGVCLTSGLLGRAWKPPVWNGFLIPKRT